MYTHTHMYIYIYIMHSNEYEYTHIYMCIYIYVCIHRVYGARSNDLVVGEVHMLEPSCQRYNWHTGRCGSIAFGSSPRRGFICTFLTKAACCRNIEIVLHPTILSHF